MENSKYDENEQVFEEHFEFLESTKNVTSNPDFPQRATMIAYIQLVEQYEKLLKTSVRISRLGDKAQKKLMKYKELLDTMRNI